VENNVASAKRENRLYIGTRGNEIYIRAEGQVTANLSFPIREHLYKKLVNMETPLSIYFDLSNTDYMDSTFMGLLVGIERRTFACFKNHIRVINPNHAAMKFLKSMRLNSILDISNLTIPDSVIFQEFDETVHIDELEKSRIVLNSHKNLSEIDTDNKKRFEKLQEILEKQIKEKSSGEPPACP
jgi:anti-anti-sigma factor